MERPVSREVAASTTTGHKRNASLRSGGRHSGSTVLSLFVTNLRLLDLDLLSDWPNITTSSFGNQDARARTRCTEFALFQLFRLYDPATTADKLQPFWPPLEPLQSINLRAALYRCLNELKKNGVLGKETVLRKTMLDDCQGDKLWELCLCFSAVVLKKVMLERRSKHGRPVAERLGSSQTLNKANKESLLPLSIAHKAALGKTLDEKKQRRETYSRLYDILTEKEAELQERKAHAREKAGVQPTQGQAAKLDGLERTLTKSYTGNTELRQALVNGDVSANGDHVLTASLDKVASAGVETASDVGLLSSLHSAANRQSQRVRRWQSMHESLLASKTASRTEHPDQSGEASKLRFDKHRSMSVREAVLAPAEKARRRSQSSAAISRYDEILTAMREDLRCNRRSTAPQPPASAVAKSSRPVRKPSVHLDTTAGAVNHHQHSLSTTSVPMRPAIGRRVSSRSKSYQQPKVESQRQPIPLKSELFSPLKSKRHSASPMSSSSLLASPVEEDASPAVGLAASLEDRLCDVSQASEANETSAIGVGLGIEQHSPDKKPTGATDPQKEDVEVLVKPDVPFKLPSLPEAKTGNLSRPSLAERTRMSMAFRSSEDSNPVSPEATPVGAAERRYEAASATVHDAPQSTNEQVSLLDRTRQSISLAPQNSQPKSKHSRARSSIYPVNQFDTPQKARRSSIGMANPRRDITPREELFSPDAGYDSVFKPRPKIALSPIISPYVDAGRMSMDGLDDVGRSSPLVGVGGRE